MEPPLTINSSRPSPLRNSKASTLILKFNEFDLPIGTPRQVLNVVNLRERRVDDDLEATFCPLCLEGPLVLYQLQAHQAKHMEDIALFIVSDYA